MYTDLATLTQDVLGCQKCPLSQGRLHAVPGDGDPHAKLLFIGEGPGKNEDMEGRPFVGAAGKFLAEMLGTIGLTREDVFIANIVKCRPPNNRDPLPVEIEACSPYLDDQIRLINPQMIVTLGRYSMWHFLPGLKISLTHGQPKKRQSDGRVILPLYHPAAALYNGSMRSVLIQDFSKIPAILEAITQSESV